MQTSPPRKTSAPWRTVFRRFGIVWFTLVAIGQTGFIFFISAYYGPRTAVGDFAAWNDKALIEGHVPGDGPGNTMFALHVLLAAVMTLTGLIQFIPAIRNRYRTLHRWSGRIFLVLACFLALGGLWLVWVRGTYLSFETALTGSLNAILIVAFAIPTIIMAMRRNIQSHQRWAMRLFMVASGVWFLRVGMMGWLILNQSPRWMTRTMNGPADIALSFGSYMIPWLGLELYYAAQRSQSNVFRIASLTILGLLTAFMAVGILGTLLIMWPNDLRAG